MKEDLPPFSKFPKCIKCGNETASTKYLESGVCIHNIGSSYVQGFEHNERLHRSCFRCEFEWDEAAISEK